MGDLQEMVVNLRIAGPESLMQFLEEHIESCRTVWRLNDENRRLQAEINKLRDAVRLMAISV